MTEMARRYEHGIGCPRDIGRALFLYKRAAAAGDPAAMLALGDIYREGVCVERDVAYSNGMYRKAADLGFAPAIFRLAEHGPLSDREPLLRKAAEQGYGPAMTAVGEATGDVEWLKRAVAAKHPPAFAKLASRTEDGRTELLRQGAELGDAVAQAQLGLLLEPTDRDAALKLFVTAAEAGEPRAMERRGRYAQSEGEALVWYRKAAEAGIPEALDWMGDRSDSTVARLLWKRAADAAYAPAMRKLAILDGNEALLRAAARAGDAEALFRIGDLQAAAERGHPEALARTGQVEKAAALGHAASLKKLGRILEAAEQGDPEACWLLGRDMDDAAEGTRWIQRAAEKGHVEATRELALRYKTGRGAPLDTAVAAQWMTKAAEAGDAEALFHAGRVQESAAKGHPPALVALGDRASLEKAAAAGYANAWTKLGQIEKAAVMGDPEAKVLLASQGKMGPRDACRLYREAADAGYVPAMLRIADCHLQGRGVSRSELDAVNWWRKAAAAGSSEAAELLRRSGKGM